MTKHEFAKAIDGGKVSLVCIGQGYSKEYRGSYNRYRIIVDGDALESYNCPWYKEIPYFVKRSGCMAMTIWGSSQEFEALYCLAGIVKNELRSIPKDHGDFCRWFRDKIKVIY